jgi:hypothetical protein
MLCCPARSAASFSSRFPGGTVRSARVSAASSIASFRQAARCKGGSSFRDRLRRQMASVSLSRKDRSTHPMLTRRVINATRSQASGPDEPAPGYPRHRRRPRNAERHDGSWWQDWASWADERAGRLGRRRWAASAIPPSARRQATTIPHPGVVPRPRNPGLGGRDTLRAAGRARNPHGPGSNAPASGPCARARTAPGLGRGHAVRPVNGGADPLPVAAQSCIPHEVEPSGTRRSASWLLGPGEIPGAPRILLARRVR